MKTHIRANWSHAILVCKKCSKKQAKKGVAFGPHKKRFAAALKRELGAGKSRKSPVGVVEVSCLDICPKSGVVVIDTRAPDDWRVIGPDGDFEEQVRPLR